MHINEHNTLNDEQIGTGQQSTHLTFKPGSPFNSTITNHTPSECYELFFFYLELYYRSITNGGELEYFEYFCRFFDDDHLDESLAFFFAINLIEEHHRIYFNQTDPHMPVVINKKLIDILLDYVQFETMSEEKYHQRAPNRRRDLKNKIENWYACTKFNLWDFEPVDKEYDTVIF